MAVEREWSNTSNDVELLFKANDGRAAYLINDGRRDLSNCFPAVLICYSPVSDCSHLIGKIVVAHLESGITVVRKLVHQRGNGTCDLLSYYRAPILEENVSAIRRIASYLVQMDDPMAAAQEALSQPWRKFPSEEGSVSDPRAN